MPAKKKAKKAAKKAAPKKKATAKKAAPKKAMKKKAAPKAMKKKAAPKAAKKKAAPKKAKKAPKPKKVRKPRKPNPAFMAPLIPDEALAVVVGSSPLPRTEITKRLWDYIKKNNLQDARNRRQINADAALRPIFGRPNVTMFEMNKLIQSHLRKA